MRPCAIIVNTARGGLIVEDDLATAVRDRLIAGAAIDVLASEPPDDDHPLVRLSRERNFILTPHTAWASTEAMQTLSDQMIDNIENFMEGSPTNVCT
jgi:glycerate dehydrogenase